MTEVIATISQIARQSPHISQRSGVSVRLSVSNQEVMVANAARRALIAGEDEVVPRVCDLEALPASTLCAPIRSLRLRQLILSRFHPHNCVPWPVARCGL